MPNDVARLSICQYYQTETLHWKDLDIRNPFCPCPGLNTVSKICQPVSFAILAKKWITRKFVRHLQIWQIIIVFKIRRFMFCKVFGILQLKLFNLFQAFNSWGSSKRCEQKKKNRRGLLLIFFLVLCLRATLHYQNAWKRLETISWRVSLSDFGMVSWLYFAECLG